MSRSVIRHPDGAFAVLQDGRPVAGGVTPTQAAAWLGNSPGTILRHYRRVRPAELLRVAAARGLTRSTDPRSDPSEGE